MDRRKREGGRKGGGNTSGKDGGGTVCHALFYSHPEASERRLIPVDYSLVLSNTKETTCECLCVCRGLDKSCCWCEEHIYSLPQLSTCPGCFSLSWPASSSLPLCCVVSSSHPLLPLFVRLSLLCGSLSLCSTSKLQRRKKEMLVERCRNSAPCMLRNQAVERHRTVCTQSREGRRERERERGRRGK